MPFEEVYLHTSYTILLCKSFWCNHNCKNYFKLGGMPGQTS